MKIEQTENGYTLRGTDAELQELITAITATTGVTVISRTATVQELTIICTNWYGKEQASEDHD